MFKKARNATKELLQTLLKTVIGFFFGLCKIEDHLVIHSFDKSPVVVDLGTGTGEFPDGLLRERRFAKLFASAKFILVEPDPSLVQELTRKFEYRQNFGIVEAAVGNEKKDNAKFYLRKGGGNSLYHSLVGDNYQNETNVRVVTLEDLFSLFNLRKIDLLKVDIEGAEWDLFENFSKCDFERIYQISVEFHDFLNPSLRERTERSIRLLQEFGYHLIRRGSDYAYGTPYFDCLFYNSKRLKWTIGARLLRYVPSYLSKWIWVQ
jgi:FkbM family methyltransferase